MIQKILDDKNARFLPVNKSDLKSRGLETLDFIVVSADAYVDHPTFGHALIARLVESQGFSVGIIAQPLKDEDYLALGIPSKAFLISGGVVDSMVNNYTVALKKRSDDVYSDNGRAGMRPDRVLTVYCNNLKRLSPSTPLIIGGLEGSLRRLAHYDYWSDTVMRSILFDTKADLLIYGMGEKPILDITDAASKNIPLDKIKNILGTAYMSNIYDLPLSFKKHIEANETDEFINISSFDRVSRDKKLYQKAFLTAFENTDPFTSKGIIQKQDYEHYVIINPPAKPLLEKEMDFVYNLPFAKEAHPMYNNIPALEEVKFSITAHRGCFGNCSFCAITFHQGKIIQNRSNDNIIDEVEKLTKFDDFKGYIHDIGGPTANFHEPSCKKQLTDGVCKDRECIGYEKCPNLKVDHSKYLDILSRAKRIKGVKSVFIRSGIRYDYLMADKDKTFFKTLVKDHVSGQLKVAPEHISETTLKLMNKPRKEIYDSFCSDFYKNTKEANKEQYLVPYFISSHPGTTLQDAISLTEYLIQIGHMPKQVQDFYPTPSTLSTTMYYTELHPITLEKIYVAKSSEDKAMQRALLQYRLPKNKAIIEKALRLAKREDLLKHLYKDRHEIQVIEDKKAAKKHERGNESQRHKNADDRQNTQKQQDNQGDNSKYSPSKFKNTKTTGNGYKKEYSKDNRNERSTDGKKEYSKDSRSALSTDSKKEYSKDNNKEHSKFKGDNRPKATRTNSKSNFKPTSSGGNPSKPFKKFDNRKK